MADITLCVYVDVSSKRPRSTFVTSLTSDEHDIAVQKFRHMTRKQTTKRGQTGRIYLASTTPFRSVEGVGKEHCFRICGKRKFCGWHLLSWAFVRFAKSDENSKLGNMGQACGTDKSESLVYTQAIVTMFEPELTYSWFIRKGIDHALRCWRLTMRWHSGS